MECKGFLHKIFDKNIVILLDNTNDLEGFMNEEFINVSACPYCGHKLDKFPTRKSQCKFCKETYYVRTDPRTNKQVIATENGIKQIEDMWVYRREYDYLVNKFSRFGVMTRQIEKMKNNLFERFNSEPSINDITWGLYNELIIRENESVYPDFDTLSEIYREMAIICSKDGKDFFELLSNSYKFELLKIKRDSEKTKTSVNLIISPSYMMAGACENCRSQYGKKITLDDALKTMPLPCKNCIFEKDENNPGFCRCRYEIEYNFHQY